MADRYENQAPETQQVCFRSTQTSDPKMFHCFLTVKPNILVIISSNKKLLSESYFNFNTKQGKFQAKVICCILGIGGLVAWNSLLTIADYYYHVFPVRFCLRTVKFCFG